MEKQEYVEYVETLSHKSNLLKDIFFAFIFGGLICLIGELLKDIFLFYNFDKKDSAVISTILLILIGAVLTAFQLYEKIGKIGGAGTVIPITGFSNSIVAPAIEYKSEGYILGIGSNMFKVAGPVLVYGILSSFILGIIYYIIKVVL